MPTRTQMFRQFPWIGGVNTSLDEAVIPANQLTRARNLLFGVRGSRKKRPGIDYDWDDATVSAYSILEQCDFWYGAASGKTQKRVAVDSNKALFTYNPTSGARTTITDSGTAWSTAITQASFLVMNNLLIFAVDGSGNVMKKWTGTGNAKNLGVYTTTANTTNASANLTTIADTAGALVGAVVTGTGIPANTIINSIAGTTAVLSNNATATNSSVLITFTNPCPVASILREHQGRAWSNDKTNVDRLNYSTTSQPEQWLGNGDSGALDVGVGDGDPDGIVAIFPTYKGVLFVAKKTKLYRITGTTPEDYAVELVTAGVGCVAHSAIAPVDLDDMVFVSDRGIHSLAATASFGDFEEKFLSKDIQTTFNDNFVKARRKYIKAAYDAKINSIAFAVTDSDFGATSNNTIWFYNLTLESWYCWPNVSCESLVIVNDADEKRLYVGTNTGRIGKTFNDANYDVSTAGVNTAVQMDIKTGLIYPTGDPQIVVGFKKFYLLYRPRGTHTITVTLTIDNFAPQSFTFSETSSDALLGSTFVLGSSSLGFDRVLGSYGISIDGYGQGVSVRIIQSGTDEQVEIQGFALEYEQAGIKEEVLN